MSSIHQPSSEILNTFDKILLKVQGKITIKYEYKKYIIKIIRVILHK